MSHETVVLLPQLVLLAFVTFFVGVVVWAYRMPALEAEALSRLPLSMDDLPLAPASNDDTQAAGGDRHE